MSRIEKYEFEIGEEGLDYDILDMAFTQNTQKFILNNNLKEGMSVLDVGSGAGEMTVWLAKQVGKSGTVIAVDNSPEQLSMVENKIKRYGLNNVKTKVLSAYELSKLNQSFDAVYCRFLLHHLHSPRQAIDGFYSVLNSNGYYYGQEGIISAAFAYPASFAWQGYMPELKSPQEDLDGINRDGDFGMKLFYNCLSSGFIIDDYTYHQPMLWKKEHKQLLLSGLTAYKQSDLQHGVTEDEWQKKYDETVRMINDPKQIIAFYGSCLIAARKP